jgi:phosphoribosylaminoimidazolecarboxamide formyltransferase/IMP cyclohydrolase
MSKRYALISVSDKTGLIDLARRLVELEWSLIASGGTGRALEAASIPFVPVEQMTGNPEAFDGRMKTISFQLEGGILFDRRNPRHVEQAESLGIVPIHMVVCNFYPFKEAVANPDCTLDEAVEQIDVGGPTMVRAAAKNFANVIVLTDPAQYQEAASALEQGDLPLALRKNFAIRAFDLLAETDMQVAQYLRGDDPTVLHLEARRALRYGENPQQEGAYYALAGLDDPLALHRFVQHQGKELSYNNLLDADAVLYALSLLGGERPAAVIVKHTNPSGAAFGEDIADAFVRAWEGDPLAAFGGIIALNRAVDRVAAETIGTERFFEVLLAPAIDPDALEILKPRKNLRILINPALARPRPSANVEYRTVRGGMLVQRCDIHALELEALPAVTRQSPSEAQRRDLWMAWQICRASRSNAVTLVRDEMLVGNGVGQQDRVRSCRIAVEKAGARAQGASAASDAFFPFPDGPEVLARAGIAAIVHPGGSVRDQETVDRMNELGVAMVTTGGIRCFRH